mgnify:CR=1 FL=1
MPSISVPATTANVGPGFDCLGMALSLYNDITVDEIPDGLEIEVGGRDKEKIKTDESNLVYQSMLKTFERIGEAPKGLRIKQFNRIPISRGLGSSAACIVGGIMAVNKLKGLPLSQDEVLELAVEIEGHPDNVTPALLGGVAVSHSNMGKVNYVRFPVHRSLKFIVAIPQVELSTKASRGALPDRVSFQDAVFNIGTSSLLVAALMSGDFEKIAYGLQDRIHQPYRIELVDSLRHIFNEAEVQNLKHLFLSGAGPSVIYMTWEEGNREKERKFCDLIRGMSQTWDIQILKGDNEGVRFK